MNLYSQPTDALLGAIKYALFTVENTDNDNEKEQLKKLIKDVKLVLGKRFPIQYGMWMSESGDVGELNLFIPNSNSKLQLVG